MANQERLDPDFRFAETSKKTPKAVADGTAGMLLGLAEVSGTPEQTFRAVMTYEGASFDLRRQDRRSILLGDRRDPTFGRAKHSGRLNRHSDSRSPRGHTARYLSP